MIHSLEQNQYFHLARRISRVFAPDYRIFATDRLEAGECVVDHQHKTIEVSEYSPFLDAAAGILFQTGHLRLRHRPEFAEHFGSINDTSEKRLISKLIKQGLQADELAQDWARKVFVASFPVSKDTADKKIAEFVWSYAEWETYYKSAS